MKKRHNVLLWMVIVVLALALSACGANGNVTVTKADTENTQTDAATQESDPADLKSDLESGATQQNVLVAYFSYSGNTEKVAEQIAGYIGGDLAQIQRAESYDDLYTEAKEEIDEGVHPEITVSVDNVEDYNVIFVGYPIWWNEAPAMIGTFLSNYDFSGKTIIPFCTSSSSKIDNSLHIFNELCPDAEIAEGLTANNPDDIEPWLQSLGFME